MSLLCLFGMISVSAETITVAVASNFAPVAPEIAARFEAETGHSIRISFASTGKLYTQIMHGAPFDVLLAADIKHPQLLESSGQGVASSRSTYAIGRLMLWSRDPALRGTNCRDTLANLGQKRLAIANPETAPYGAAAKETLISLNLWDQVEPRLVIGESIAQTLQYVVSGNASLGFIAAAQSHLERLPEMTCAWPIPPQLHQPIEQQAVLLQHGADNTVAAYFMVFLHGTTGRAIIANHGYTLPIQPHDK